MTITMNSNPARRVIDNAGAHIGTIKTIASRSFQASYCATKT
jgi:hypothetical protein